MVLLAGDSLNDLFDTLQEWERHLAQVGFDGLRCDHERLKPKI